MDRHTPIGPRECPRCPGQHHWPRDCPKRIKIDRQWLRDRIENDPDLDCEDAAGRRENEGQAMRVKPGDLLYWDDEWEATYTDDCLDEMADGLDEGDVITIYRARAIEPAEMLVVSGRLVPAPES